MDFTQAALLIGAVLAITKLVDDVAGTDNEKRTTALHLIVGVAITFLVAYSTYGSTQSIGNVALSNVNVPGLVLIGLMVGGGATVTRLGFKAVSNIGQNQDR